MKRNSGQGTSKDDSTSLSGVLVVLSAFPLGNGMRPKGFKLATVTCEPGVTLEEVRMACCNPHIAGFSDEE